MIVRGLVLFVACFLWTSPLLAQGCPGSGGAAWGIRLPFAFVSQDAEPGSSGFRGGVGGWVSLTDGWSLDIDYSYNNLRSNPRGSHRVGLGTSLVLGQRIRPCVELLGLTNSATGLASGEHYRAFAAVIGLGLSGRLGRDPWGVTPYVTARLAAAGSDAALFGFEFSENSLGGGGEAGIRIGTGAAALQLSVSRYWLDDDLGPHPLGDRSFEVSLVLRPSP